MRLIDADKIDFTPYIDPFEIPGAQYAVEQSPTIEAIPVEWLEEKINMYEYLADHAEGIWAERYDEWAHLLSQMIEKWRRENEG